MNTRFEHHYALGYDAWGQPVAELLFRSLGSALGESAFAVGVLFIFFVGLFFIGFFKASRRRLLLTATLEGLALLPDLVLVMTLGVLLPPHLLIPFFSFVQVVPGFWRLAEGQREWFLNQEFKHSAVALGQTEWRLYLQHFLPTLLPSLGFLAIRSCFRLMLLQAYFDFLGIGPELDPTSLGQLLWQARDYLLEAPWMMIQTTFVLLAMAVGFDKLGKWLKQRYNVRIVFSPKL